MSAEYPAKYTFEPAKRRTKKSQFLRRLEKQQKQFRKVREERAKKSSFGAFYA
jgi:hypothetical protein